MGPTNVALVKLFQADQKLREAQARLDAATKDVRVQERRVNDLTEKMRASQTRHKETQAKAGVLEVDLKVREEHIEKLRTQQQVAKNNKEYQAFLIEINTQKVDKSKAEEQTIQVMEQVEKLGTESTALAASVDEENKKLAAMRESIGGKTTELQAEIDTLTPIRDLAHVEVPPKGKVLFDKMSDRFEGEALASISKPNPREEEYLCDACFMSLVADVYNRLHTRDEIIFCPSCARILYIPEDLTPDVAVNKKKEVKKPTTPRVKGEKKPRGKKDVPGVTLSRQLDATAVRESVNQEALAGSTEELAAESATVAPVESEPAGNAAPIESAEAPVAHEPEESPAASDDSTTNASEESAGTPEHAHGHSV